MFNYLSKKLAKCLTRAKNSVLITPQLIDDIFKEIRIVFLNADIEVNLVDKFLNELKEKILIDTKDVKVNANSFIIKELKKALEATFLSNNAINLKKANFSCYLICGLQGSGKTTTCAKLANLLAKEDKKVLVGSVDVYRPEALTQLKLFIKEINNDKCVFFETETKEPLKIAKEIKDFAVKNGYDYLILDTAGRLHVDKKLMFELESICKLIDPLEIFYITDANIGQMALNIFEQFKEYVNVTGIIGTKMEGMAKGGSIFSIVYKHQVPIKFLTFGEKIEDIENFDKTKIVQKILSIESPLSVLKKAKLILSEKTDEKIERRILNNQYDLNDLLLQLLQIKKFNKISKFLSFMPQMQKITPEQKEIINKRIIIFTALINSMTLKERKDPKLLKNSFRKNRIIKGSGRNNQEFNLLLRQWEQYKTLQKHLKNRNLKGFKF
ncbi:signal recognition particle protein [symbiont of Argiope bruennichi]|uniref:nucleotide-binding protein n=1 Tax=symbiont of Argiope bruennichi TaxID=2810479 RepID=UPI003DA5B5F3